MDLKMLTELNAVVGHEQEMRRALLDVIQKKGLTGKIDRMGNIIVHKKGKSSNAKRVMVAAHFDEVGLLTVSATEDGFLRVIPVGAVEPRVVISKRVLVGDDKIPGVIGAMAIHLQSAADRERVLGFDSIYVDIGAKDKKEAEAKAPKGTYIAFDTPYVEFGEGCIAAKALDDRVGTYNLLRLLDDEYENDLIAAFTSKEEAGCVGAKGAAFAQDPEIGIVLEGTSANDLGMTPEVLRCCEVGKGVAVSFMDNSTIGNRGLFKKTLEIAKNENIHHQVKHYVAGMNDAGALERSRAGIPTIVLSVPCRYIHSPSSVCKPADVDDQLALTKALLNTSY